MSILTAIIGTVMGGGLPAIGSSYMGGYYAGRIVDGGVTYALIVSPKASGESYRTYGGTIGQYIPTACRTLTNGPAATAAMAALGSTYPAASWCAGLTINGYDDWYLPARDELEILYRNLKPSTTSSNNAARPDNPAIFGADGLGSGTNPNSVPIGVAYVNALVTTAPLFVTGGAQALTTGDYWSATEYGRDGAWYQVIGSSTDGNQKGLQRDQSSYVRAVRRVAI